MFTVPLCCGGILMLQIRLINRKSQVKITHWFWMPDLRHLEPDFSEQLALTAFKPHHLWQPSACLGDQNDYYYYFLHVDARNFLFLNANWKKKNPSKNSSSGTALTPTLYSRRRRGCFSPARPLSRTWPNGINSKEDNLLLLRTPAQGWRCTLCQRISQVVAGSREVAGIGNLRFQSKLWRKHALAGRLLQLIHV